MIRRLSGEDRALIADHARTVDLACGTILMTPGAAIHDIYLPESGIVLLEEPIGSQGHVEAALVGNEGLIGWSVLLGCPLGTYRATVQGGAATLLVIDAAALLAASRTSETLLAALFAFVHAITIQMSRAIVAHLDNPLDQRIARWLLMRHDRIVGDYIAVRHDEIADALNARRASVTNRLHVIEGERLIRSRRGRITILDRLGLEAFAGTSFGAAEAEYRRLLGTFGKS